MTETEWLEGGYAPDLLDHLRQADGRKLRLFACACCRAEPVWRRLQRPESRALVETAERFADGLATLDELESALHAAPKGKVVYGIFSMTRRPDHLTPFSQAERAAIGAACLDAWEGAWQSARMVQSLLSNAQVVVFLHDVFGNPFRPRAIVRSCITLASRELAEVIYQERTFDRMPELAEALERAGCADAEILNHCRGPGPHVHGCWVLDQVLGRT